MIGGGLFGDDEATLWKELKKGLLVLGASEGKGLLKFIWPWSRGSFLKYGVHFGFSWTSIGPKKGGHLCGARVINDFVLDRWNLWPFPLCTVVWSGYRPLNKNTIHHQKHPTTIRQQTKRPNNFQKNLQQCPKKSQRSTSKANWGDEDDNDEAEAQVCCWDEI